MSDPDEVMQQVGRGIGAGRHGDTDLAREIFEGLWRKIGGEEGPPLQRCAIAHSMADVQADPNDELVWDLRALAAADSVTDEHTAAAGMAGSAAALYPSLHLNLADVLLRLGDVEAARHHLGLGRAAVGALPDDGYRAMVVEGLDGVEQRLLTTEGP